MAAIRGKDTQPELTVRRALHAAGFRYRLHQRDLPGRPDIVLTRYRTVVFVHGCFWHHHGCKHSTWPKTRAAFWRAKIESNQARDRRTRYFLRQAGWRVETIWECQLKDERAVGALVQRLRGLRRRTKPDA
jgi:DNA mismatch endonuclease (patch repair protein)